MQGEAKKTPEWSVIERRIIQLIRMKEEGDLDGTIAVSSLIALGYICQLYQVINLQWEALRFVQPCEVWRFCRKL